MTDLRSLIENPSRCHAPRRRAQGQRTKSQIIHHCLPRLLAGEDRSFVRNFFCAVSISLINVTEKTCSSSIARQKAGRNSCEALRPTLFG